MYAQRLKSIQKYKTMTKSQKRELEEKKANLPSPRSYAIKAAEEYALANYKKEELNKENEENEIEIKNDTPEEENNNEKTEGVKSSEIDEFSRDVTQKILSKIRKPRKTK